MGQGFYDSGTLFQRGNVWYVSFCTNGREIQKSSGSAKCQDAVRRETATVYLKVAGIAVRPPGVWSRLPPAKPANNPIADPDPDSKPANDVTTDSMAISSLPGGDVAHSPCLSSETIERGLSRGR
jgi:hypothetical protein